MTRSPDAVFRVHNKIYRAICERLEAIDHITDAAECFHEMEYELG